MRSDRNAASHSRWLVAWIFLSGVSSLSNIAAWVWHVDGVVRVVSNVAWLFGLPGWIPLYALGTRGIRDHPLAIVTANTLAWGVWMIAFVIMRAFVSTVRSHRTDASALDSIDNSRRRFIANAGVGMVGAGFVGAPTYGAAVEPAALHTRAYDMPITNLPDELDGLRIVQFADPHLGPRIPATFIESAVERAIALKPDIVVLNGDYVGHGEREIERIADLLTPLTQGTSIGVVGVLGNHDWWANGPRMKAELERVGVWMIDNDRVWLHAKSRILSATASSDSLALVGLGDLSEDDTDIDAAFRDIDPSTPRLLVTHQPDTAELDEIRSSSGPRIDLMLCGHTHGGQVRIPFIGTPLVPSAYGQKYAGGLVRGPRFPVIVSRGLGMSLLPVRVGVPPELSSITLRRV